MNGHQEVGRRQRDDKQQQPPHEQQLLNNALLPRSESPIGSLYTERPRSLADIAALLPPVPRRSESPTKPAPSLSPSQGVSRLFATRFSAASAPTGPSTHAKARSGSNAAYKGKRVEVPDDKVPWSVEWCSYAPIEFTDTIVLENNRDLPYSPISFKWADPPGVQELREELEKRSTYTAGAEEVSMGGHIEFDEHGAPLNPEGRTGLRGRGLLGKWGPNHAADPIVTRHSPLTGVLQVLCILRKDTDQWALPGGIVRAGESVSVTARKGIQECGHSKQKSKKTEEFKMLVDGLFSRGVPVFMGYSDDPRNTDNAWMETKVMHFHCSAELGSLLPLKAEGAKAGALVWLDADSTIEPRYGRLYGSHLQWVEQALAPLRQEEAAAVDVMGMSQEAMVFSQASSLGQVAVAQLTLALALALVLVLALALALTLTSYPSPSPNPKPSPQPQAGGRRAAAVLTPPMRQEGARRTRRANAHRDLPALARARPCRRGLRLLGGGEPPAALPPLPLTPTLTLTLTLTR